MSSCTTPRRTGDWPGFSARSSPFPASGEPPERESGDILAPYDDEEDDDEEEYDDDDEDDDDDDDECDRERDLADAAWKGAAYDDEEVDDVVVIDAAVRALTGMGRSPRFDEPSPRSFPFPLLLAFLLALPSPRSPPRLLLFSFFPLLALPRLFPSRPWLRDRDLDRDRDREERFPPASPLCSGRETRLEFNPNSVFC